MAVTSINARVRGVRWISIALFFAIAGASRAWKIEHVLPDPVIPSTKECIPWKGQLSGDRRLMVSNSPETITDISRPVLWHHRVQTDPDASSSRHRIFLWHANGMTGRDIRVGVTVENLSPWHELTLSEVRVVAAVGTRANPIATVGLPVAKRALDIERAPQHSLPDTSIAMADAPGGAAVRGIIGWNLKPGQMVGAVIEFTVQQRDGDADTGINYMARTVAGTRDEQLTGNLRLREGSDGHGLAPLIIKRLADGTRISHTRGSWEHSSIIIDNRHHPFIYSTKPRYALVTFPDANDLLMTRATSYDPAHASPDGNAGNWGVTYNIIVFTSLPPEGVKPRPIEMRLVSLNTRNETLDLPYAYAGVMRVGRGDSRAIQPIKWGTGANGTQVVWVFHPQPGEFDSQSFQLMHAGGACLPVGIRLKGL